MSSSSPTTAHSSSALACRSRTSPSTSTSRSTRTTSTASADCSRSSSTECPSTVRVRASRAWRSRPWRGRAGATASPMSGSRARTRTSTRPTRRRRRLRPLARERRTVRRRRKRTEMEFRTDYPEDYRAGFACFVGRPNTGKSTLTNALVGEKVAITSAKPQTTRHTIRGIVHRDDHQLILIDTPGLHKPRTLLGSRLNDLVATTLNEVDVIGFCLPADEPIGPGDRYIASQLELLDGRTPIVALVTKVDLVPKDKVAEALLAVGELADFADVVPVSAAEGFQVDTVDSVLAAHLPVSPPLYPDGDLTDEPEEAMIAELVREAALEGVRDELPHSLAVQVEEMYPREGRSEDNPLWNVHVNLFVERPSQKAIIIGSGGSRLKAIGSESRRGIEGLLGTKVYLDLHVKVAKDWQRDPKQLGRLGFDFS